VSPKIFHAQIHAHLRNSKACNALAFCARTARNDTKSTDTTYLKEHKYIIVQTEITGKNVN